MKKALIFGVGILIFFSGCVTETSNIGVPGLLPRVEVGVKGGKILDLGGALQKKQPQKQNKKSVKPKKPSKPAQQKKPPTPPPPPPEKKFVESPILKFGTKIYVDKKTGMITKIYYVPLGTGATIKAMLQGGGKSKPLTFIQRILSGYPLTIEVLQKFAVLPGSGSFKYGDVPKAPTPFTDCLIVTSTMEGLEAFERAFNMLFAQTPQVQIEVKVVEITETEILDIGVKQSGSSPTIKRLKSPSSMLIQSFTSNFPNYSGLGKNPILTSEGLFTIGGIHNDWELKAILEFLQTQTRADVISQPKIAVRNGGVAEISTTTEVPYPRARISGQTIITTDITFKRIGVLMKIRPVISGTDKVFLQIDVKVDAVTDYADTDPIRTPVVASRSAKTDVILKNGNTVIIGGLITQREAEAEKKVPILGDIPVLGMLFRSTFKERKKSEVIFFIKPTIIEEGTAETQEQFLPLGT